MKTCFRCNTEKPEDAFYFNKRFGRTNYDCKECSTANVKYRRKRRGHWIDRWKRATGCSSCKTTVGLLHLHHVDKSTKEFNPSDGRGLRLKRFMGEVRKCIVLCHTCHTKHHLEEELLAA